MKVNVIGIGAGNPKHLTLQAIEAMKEVDLFLVADKGEVKDDLVDARRAICDKYLDPGYKFVTVPDPIRQVNPSQTKAEYDKGIADWHEARTKAYADIILPMDENAVLGFLAWGDPSFYDATLRTISRLQKYRKLEANVIPGISAFQALAAEHKILLNAVGSQVHITTGRRLVEEWRAELGTTVVMLDSFLRVKDLVEKAPNVTLYWGAYLGLPYQVIRSGRLADIIDDLVTERALLREKIGWLMDVYAIVP